MENLFTEFNKVGIDEWIEKIHTDLKGKPTELLTAQPEFDLNFKSYYHRDEASKGNYPTFRTSNQWTNRKVYSEATNKLILSDLNEGIDHLGLKVKSQEEFDALTKDVQFEYIQADVTFSDPLVARSFIAPSNVRLIFDPIALNLTSGNNEHSLEDYLSFYKEQRQNDTLFVSGSIYGNAGASSSQELALIANHLNEYMQLLHDNDVSLDEINSKLAIELSVTEDYFANVAKFKLVGYITALVFRAYDPDYQLKPFKVYGKTSRRFLAINDHNNNLLRQTTMAMSALIGGCDAITVDTLSTGDWDKDQIMERMAKNIPLVLQEESYLNKVTDPAEGSYYVEHLCAQLINKSWELFKEVENAGGLLTAVQSGLVQSKIDLNKTALISAINEGKKTFLGVNKYPSTLEEWKDTGNANEPENGEFRALTEFRVEPHYKAVAHEQN